MDSASLGAPSMPCETVVAVIKENYAHVGAT